MKPRWKPKLNIALALVFVSYCGFAHKNVSASVFVPVFLPNLTHDIRKMSNGGTYNVLYPNSTLTLAGVPFTFRSDALGNTVFALEERATFSIPVGVFGVREVYSLINSYSGTQNSNVGFLEFVGSKGNVYTVDLVIGRNIRDHYYGGFVNTTSDPSTIQAVFGSNQLGKAHFDLQVFDLPSSFQNEVLQYIIFHNNAYPDGSRNSGRAMIAAITVQGEATDYDCDITDAVSREFSALVDTTSGLSITDAVSREFSALVDTTAGLSITDAVSREFSAYCGTDAILSTNSDAISREFSVLVADTSPPDTIIVAGPAEGATVYAFPILFSASGSDNTISPSGLLFAWRFDGGPWSQFSPSSSFELTGLPDGLHIIEVKSMDAAGQNPPSPLRA